MAVANPRKLFVNLAIRDLKKSMDFFTSSASSSTRSSPTTMPPA